MCNRECLSAPLTTLTRDKAKQERTVGFTARPNEATVSPFFPPPSSSSRAHSLTRSPRHAKLKMCVSREAESNLKVTDVFIYFFASTGVNK